jgi:glycosyltransferase involved in cell wall biosynthesis
MSSNPEVTVVMIFLNAGEFIREAIESVFAQSYTDWELVFVDDGSTDESTAIALETVKKYPQKARYLEHPNHENRGASASRNVGIRSARGDLIALIDADDVWLPDKLAQQVEIMKRHPEAAMVYGYTYYWYSWAGDGEDLLIEPGFQLDSVVNPPDLPVKFLRGDAPVPCPSDVMVRREAVEAVGGFEESFRRIFTDQVFYAKLCTRFPIYVSGQCWFKYRKHSNSSVSVVKKGGQWRAERLNYLRWLEGYLSEKRVDDKELRKAIKIARLKCLHPKLARMREHALFRALALKERLRSAARFVLPVKMHRWLRARWHSLINSQ